MAKNRIRHFERRPFVEDRLTIAVKDLVRLAKSKRASKRRRRIIFYRFSQRKLPYVFHLLLTAQATLETSVRDFSNTILHDILVNLLLQLLSFHLCCIV